MLIVKNVKVPLESDFTDIKKLFCSLTKTDNPDLTFVKLNKKAIDARKKDMIVFNCSFVIASKNEGKLKKHLSKFNVSEYKEKKYVYSTAFSKMRPIVSGFGPAGIFSAYSLAKAGLKPIVIERGKDIESRKKDVEAFFKGGKLKADSNIQFGEGGAGTFSDGKLNTGINDSRIKEVLNVFYTHGAPENILYDSKPHIGTDILSEVVKSIRTEIIALGGEILFEHKLSGFNIIDSKIHSVKVKNKSGYFDIKCDSVILAIGHSARDTFEILRDTGFEMQPKPFAIGARIEHSRKQIDKAQYGKFHSHPALSAADYKLSCHLENGRGVFSFCMCPGGEVINASSEPKSITTNGMSNSKRDGENSNSAILVNVDVEDYYKGDVLDGMYFQREIEKKAYNAGNGYPVCQSVGEFLEIENIKSSITIKPTVKPGVTYAKINEVLPDFVTDSIKEALPLFNKKIDGFTHPQALLTAPETRSSSPVRILRNDFFESNIQGIFPAGEGAGYAGGIMSAAVDGLKCAEAVIEKINKKASS